MEILKKLENNERLNFDEATKLWDLDLFDLAKFANLIREQKNGKKVFFNSNRHINPSNLCADTCKFCAFSAHRKNEKQSYTMSKDEILGIVADTVERGTKEVHIVSSHNPNLKPEWFFDLFSSIKAKFPNLHIKAMTAAEVDFFKRKWKMPYEETLKNMIASGVDSMPGGGAEIFDEGVREQICKGKVSSANWLEIHKIWHKMGRQSNATMLFGHIENFAHRTDHILRIRGLQDEALKNGNGGGFNAFIPLVYQRENNYLQTPKAMGSAEVLKTIAIARILLDNVAHIKAYWATSTLNLALVAQEFGADDIDGTIENESIQSSAGAQSKKGVNKKDFIDLIQTAGLIPVERDSLYNELQIYAS
ncbi:MULTISPECIES: aminofutalosine synthase MqnE [unclassified Campylobacter]|uniref:aminofutalosine synthase MqnE n=1 Tax=unclassified Campylobacter TaxID=2593542 RepID=UPI0022E9A377|nr:MULTISPECIES: aminofutalosine synthase MqnE [unclassified Campylobacter]MDA3053766.1 aminofutalosine synthase MqnE [Campylobacter sp. VBCF_07 NA4]MDA3060345.1 aminofutalosine synthase MqnE [Campylobacter sp. VBCF_02 NA5]MDA3069855.1 aminofutalosine synthase MqnE [Campylobacter sp. VBCF_08 NA3]WBR54818.1 aminofutalosine synthase MqnE [Campylobacter sp. VBCF_01 NA2]